MRYHARRILSGEWLSRDLPLTNVSRTKNLSGPGEITADIPLELGRAVGSDGVRLLDDWGTMILAENAAGEITHHGIVVPQTTYEESLSRVTCAGVSAYPHGYIYTGSRLWGPGGTGDAANRPDPIQIFRDHWAWIQAQRNSNLSVNITGAASSVVRIGSNEEPYRLAWYDVPDLGAEIDTLVSDTPFDFVESARWASSDRNDVVYEIAIGYPRTGWDRYADQRYSTSENIIDFVTVNTTDYADQIIGIGNGDGSKMARAVAAKDGLRLRRTRVLTDKTATQERIAARTLVYLERLNSGVDISQVTVRDHPNARVSAIRPGDDIRVQADSPTYGPIDLKVRILSVQTNDDDDTAVLGTQASAFFLYNSVEQLT